MVMNMVVSTGMAFLMCSVVAGFFETTTVVATRRVRRGGGKTR